MFIITSRGSPPDTGQMWDGSLGLVMRGHAKPELLQELVSHDANLLDWIIGGKLEPERIGRSQPGLMVPSKVLVTSIFAEFGVQNKRVSPPP